MIILQMMKPTEGIFHDVAKEYTSFRKMSLMMKPRLMVNDEAFIFIGIYKGYFYSLSDGNLLKFFITNNSGEVIKDTNISIKVMALYNILFSCWIMKEHIKNTLNGNMLFKDEENILDFIKDIKKLIYGLDKFNNSNIINDGYEQELKIIADICYVKPRKRKKLPYNFDELKKKLYTPFNNVFEKAIFSEADLILLINCIDNLNAGLNLTIEWKKHLENYWIHY
jgi:hypothetical protein